MGDSKILEYKDVVLRDSDLDTLRGPCFLNDQIIAFYFSYLFSSSNSNDILLVGPSISFCLTNCLDDKFVEEFAESSKLSKKNLVLMVVNDSDDFGGGDNGSHWSILVYDRLKNSFLHFDSMEGVNNFHAMKLYDAIKKYIGPGGNVTRQQTSSSSQKKQRNKKKLVQPVSSKSLGGTKPESVGAPPSDLPLFMECNTPQQSNGYDCGLYVLAIAKALCQWWSRGKKENDLLSIMEKNVDESVEVRMRSEVLEIIHDLTED